MTGNRGDVERVARVGFEGADAALAEDHVVVAAGEDVFGAEQKFFHRGGHAALEQDGLADFAERAEQMIILHVARADLKNIDVLAHHLNLRRVHHFADDEQTEFVGGFAHQLQAFFAHALKGIGRSARLEGAARAEFLRRLWRRTPRRNRFARGIRRSRVPRRRQLRCRRYLRRGPDRRWCLRA